MLVTRTFLILSLLSLLQGCKNKLDHEFLLPNRPVLINQGKGSFLPLKNSATGISVIGESKSIVRLDLNYKRFFILVGRNNHSIGTRVLKDENPERIKPGVNEKSAYMSLTNGKYGKV